MTDGAKSMNDFENIIHGLEHCKKHGQLCGKDCSGHYERYTEDGCAIKLVDDYRSACPYKDDKRGCIVGLTDDVLDLLKSQHETIKMYGKCQTCAWYPGCDDINDVGCGDFLLRDVEDV